MTGDASVAADRMKVFISYSRADVAFADQIVTALRDRGFDPLLDRHDLDAAENWRDRLAGLLLSCDTVVFILTDSSAASQTCAWEIEKAAKLGKRMIPIVPHELDGVTAAPPEVSNLGWIHFYSDPKLPGSGFYDGLTKLDRALRVDTEWLRTQTRLSERAYEWSRQRGEDLLLRGLALSEAEVWLSRAPVGTAAPPLIGEFLTASAMTEARRTAEGKAQIFEREEALKRAEAAVRDKEVAAARLQSTLAEKVRADRRVRGFAYFSLTLGIFLALGAAAAGWYLSNQHVASAERTSVLYAESANALSNEGNDAKAMLMALSGDPLAQGGPIEKFLRPNGYYSGRAALERGYAGNRLIRTFKGDERPVRTATFSKDGALVLTGASGGNARLFRTDTGALIATFAGGDRYGEISAAFTGEDKQVVVAKLNGEVTTWNIADRAVVETKNLFASPLHGRIALSPDGTRVAAAVTDNAVDVVGVADGKRLRTIPRRDERGDATLAFSPDGQSVLLDAGGRLEVWDVEGEGTAPVSACSMGDELAGKAMSSLTLSLDRGLAAVGMESGELLLCRSSGPATQIYERVGFHAVALSISPDGRRVLEISSDGYGRIWDVESETLAGRFSLGDAEFTSGGAAAFSADGGRLLTAYGPVAALWRADLGEQAITLADDGGAVESVAFTPDGALALTGAADGTARLWDVATGKSAGPVLVGHAAAINAVAVSPDGKLALTGSGDFAVRLWNAETGARGNVLSGHTDAVYSVAFSSNGAQVAAGAADGNVRIWALNTLRQTVVAAHTRPVYSIAFSRDGSRLLTASDDGTAKLWRVSDQVLLRTYDVGDVVWAARFSPDERYVLTGSTGRTAILWSTESGERIRTYAGHRNNVSSLAFSPDGSLILTGSMDGTAALWRTDQANPTAWFTGHTGAVRSVAFSPDGRKVMTGSYDGTARIWTVDRYLFQTPAEQQRLGCEKLAQLGMTKFEDADYTRFPILTIEPPRPCEKEWAPVAAPAAKPAAEPLTSTMQPAQPALRPASTAP